MSRVTKIISGGAYFYDQTSHRDGDKVRTKSTYIGPVDGRIYKTRNGKSYAFKRTLGTAPDRIRTSAVH